MEKGIVANYLKSTGIPYFLQQLQVAQFGYNSPDNIVSNWVQLCAVARSAKISETELVGMVEGRMISLELKLPEEWRDTVRTCELATRAVS